MGVYFSSLWNSLFKNDPVSILMVGLDAAGKTTVLWKLRLGEVVTTIPTIGFNVETVSYKNLDFTVWDVGGQFILRKLWHHYYQNAKAVIYLVDSNDITRIDEAQQELFSMLDSDELRQVPLLVLANKQDLPHAIPTAEVTKKLRLYDIKDRQWYIQGASAVSGDGLYEGLDWIARELTSRPKNNR